MKLLGAFSTPPSLPWLLKNELKLIWRGMGGKKFIWLAVLLAVLWIGFHFVAWLMLFALNKAMTSGSLQALPPRVYVWSGLAFWSFFSIGLAYSVAQSVNALFTRGDMDLLLASPVPGKSIMMVRALAVAVSAGLFPALLVLPIAHVAPFAGMPSLLAIYPALIAYCLLSAAVAILLTMSLVKWLGMRRAKVTAQILGAVIGAGAFLLSQAGNFLPRQTRTLVAAWFKAESEQGGALGPDSMLWWPTRAFLGEPLPLLLFTLLGVGAFWFTVNFTYRRFVTGTQESTTKKSAIRTGALMVSPASFRRGQFANVMTKEWRLILRDPQVISQTLLQMLYLIPMVFVGITGKQTAWLLVPGVVVLAAMLVGNLAWLTMAAEDAPELIGTSPIGITKIRRYKALAALLPVWALLLPLVLYWLFTDPASAGVLALCASCATISSAICHLWNPRKGDRRDMKARHKSSVLINLIESFSAFGWAGMAACLLGGYPWFLLLALPVALAAPTYSWWAGRRARERGELA